MAHPWSSSINAYDNVVVSAAIMRSGIDVIGKTLKKYGASEELYPTVKAADNMVSYKTSDFYTNTNE